VHEYPYPVSQGIHKLRGGVKIETDEVDDRITPQGRDGAAERRIALGSGPIEGHELHRFPLGRIVIRPARAAGHRDHFVALVHEPRHEPGADMPCGSNDYGAQLHILIVPETSASMPSKGAIEKAHPLPMASPAMQP
jgi:hypothetical protein